MEFLFFVSWVSYHLFKLVKALKKDFFHKNLLLKKLATTGLLARLRRTLAPNGIYFLQKTKENLFFEFFAFLI